MKNNYMIWKRGIILVKKIKRPRLIALRKIPRNDDTRTARMFWQMPIELINGQLVRRHWCSVMTRTSAFPTTATPSGCGPPFSFKVINLIN